MAADPHERRDRVLAVGFVALILTIAALATVALYLLPLRSTSG